MRKALREVPLHLRQEFSECTKCHAYSDFVYITDLQREERKMLLRVYSEETIIAECTRCNFRRYINGITGKRIKKKIIPFF